jgi:ABC-type multidrug transport system permease subunit
MVKARTMEYVRDKGSFYWNLLFPIALVVGFAFAFSGPGDALFKVGVLGPGDPALGFLKTPGAQYITYDAAVPQAEVLSKLRQHKLDAVVDTEARVYWINDQGKNAKLLELLMTKQDGGAKYERQWVSGPPIRYVDWLVPGVIAMNVMFSCLWGVGYVIVRYRKNGVLKRLKATPVTPLEFLAAQGLSRFLIVLATSLVVYIGTDLFLHFRMEGSYFDLLVLTALGILSMLALGLAFSSRFRNEEVANGLLNLILFPMMIFSGVFFSLEGLNPLLQGAAEVFPLTHYIRASRAIMLDGSSLWQQGPDLLFLTLFTAGCLALAAWLFRWE